MSQWKIAGKPDGTEPTVGVTYEIRHSRKGTFTMRADAVNGEWLTGTIIEGTAKALLDYNVREAGEDVTVRDTLSYLIEVSK